ALRFASRLTAIALSRLRVVGPVLSLCRSYIRPYFRTNILRTHAQYDAGSRGPFGALGEGDVAGVRVGGAVAEAVAGAPGGLVVAEGEGAETIIDPGHDAGVIRLALAQGGGLGTPAAAVVVGIAHFARCR